jgi:signal peptidase I
MTAAIRPWLWRQWRAWAKPVLTVALVMVSCRSVIADWNDVPTGSMRPTILEGDRILVDKLAYDLRVPLTLWRMASWGDPRRGDIIVFFSPADGKRLVKRVVGLPGDRLDMRDGRLWIDGTPVPVWWEDGGKSSEPAESAGVRKGRELLGARAHPMQWLPDRPLARAWGPVTVPEDRYFVLGDNRDNSRDSRFFGCVERRQIVGRATRVVWSSDPDRMQLPRWDRVWNRLP